ncbi:MAG: Gfo/Idh/MocA family oxidoreductase [Microbacterium sp.]
MEPRSQSPIRLGIIGTGAVAELHLAAIAATDAVELVAVCDIDRDRAAAVADRHAARAWVDYSVMLSEANIDGVIITSPHSLHARMATAAAAAGIAVLVEKPLATTIEDADSIIEACERAGVALATGHVLRFDPPEQKAAAAIASGSLGHPVTITHRRTAHYRPADRPAWFFDPVVAGGGIAMNVGPHGIDRIQWFGGGRITEVVADAQTRGDLAVETDVVALLRLDSGVTASLSLLSAETPYVDETVVVCERGSVRFSAAEGAWMADGGPERLLEGPSDLGHAFGRQLVDFADAIREGRPPAVSGEDGRSVLAAILALYRSSSLGGPVATTAVEALA